MCRVLGVQRSGFYAWLREPKSARTIEDERLSTMIEYSFRLSDETYGSPRITDDLHDAGERASVHRVAQIMRDRGLKARRPRRQPRYVAGKPARWAPNLLQQNFFADGPDQVWVGDTTYIPTHEGWLYLCVIVDLWSRLVVGWSMKSTRSTELAIAALSMALMHRRPKQKVIFHSDQGSEFTSYDAIDFIDENNLIQSMSRRGNCYDNAVAESFFASLKKDRTRRRRYRTRAEARADIFDYIERFYNGWRKHSTLGNLSPRQFERAAGF